MVSKSYTFGSAMVLNQVDSRGQPFSILIPPLAALFWEAGRRRIAKVGGFSVRLPVVWES